jgi:hypothetical protein
MEYALLLVAINLAALKSRARLVVRCATTLMPKIHLNQGSHVSQHMKAFLRVPCANALALCAWLRLGSLATSAAQVDVGVVLP